MKDNDKEWEVEALIAIKEEELALTVIIPSYINYVDDQIVDSRCSNHMIGDRKKLQNMTKYKGGRVVVTTNNLQLPKAHIGTTILTPRYSLEKVSLQDVYYVPSMKKNLISKS